MKVSVEPTGIRSSSIMIGYTGLPTEVKFSKLIEGVELQTAKGIQMETKCPMVHIATRKINGRIRAPSPLLSRWTLFSCNWITGSFLVAGSNFSVADKEIMNH